MNPNRHERRQAASKNKPSKSTADRFDLVVQIATEANERVGRFLQAIRVTAVHKPDVVYQMPVLLVSSEAISFGEVSQVALVYKDAKLGDLNSKAYNLTAHLGGKTVKEVAELFLNDEDAMQEALLYLVAGFAAVEKGIFFDELLVKVSQSVEKVFELLGVPRKQNG